jgi:hypothetical protein
MGKRQWPFHQRRYEEQIKTQKLTQRGFPQGKYKHRCLSPVYPFLCVHKSTLAPFQENYLKSERNLILKGKTLQIAVCLILYGLNNTLIILRF